MGCTLNDGEGCTLKDEEGSNCEAGRGGATLCWPSKATGCIMGFTPGLEKLKEGEGSKLNKEVAIIN